MEQIAAIKNRVLRQIGPYLEIFRAIWSNRDRPAYAWRILRDGVCDGCALGTNGIRDWTMPDVHLCWIRLNLLRLNTIPPFDPGVLRDAASLRELSEQDLRNLGRLPVPLIRRKGEKGFRPVEWELALGLIADRIRGLDPRRLAFYMVSRGTANETYYVAQKVARFLGTNHVDNSARICHSPSTTGLKSTIGFAATTCSYRDLIGSDLLVFIGSNAANNQPVLMKYLHMAKSQGTRVAIINPFREPGMEKFWVPSTVRSAVFGTRISDAHFSVRVGGDIAFLNGVLKHLIANDWIDRQFINERTKKWEELVGTLESQPFEELERLSGASRETMLEFARIYSRARSAVLIWSMGITMHRHGVDNVRAIANLALARGMVGRKKTGLMPIRGHSGVQGGSEMGCVPNQFPGGLPTGGEGAGHLCRSWGFEVPAWKGYFAAEMVDAAAQGELDALYSAGSNLAAVLPDPRYTERAIGRIPLRIHHDIVLNPQMFIDPADTVVLLPATTRYEMTGGNTETSTERRVIFNPEIPGPRVPGARDEWRVLVEIARRARPDAAEKIFFANTAEIRQEIARVIPLYEGIQNLRKKGDQFQWGGVRLAADGRFGFPDGKARFAPVSPPDRQTAPGRFRLSTRRGKQFNSMVFGKGDLLVGATRDSVLLCREDLDRLDLKDGDPVLVRTEAGQFRGRARQARVHPGTVVMYFPEANILIPRGVVDPECGIPAYRDADAEVIPHPPGTAARAWAGSGSPA